MRTAALKHGTTSGYWQHYDRAIPVCQECRAAATAAQKEARRQAREVDSRKVVPYGWPCPDCEWSRRFKLSDGRIVSWRLERCPKHRGYW